MTTNKLPQTDSIQELAKFWDSHDVTDFDDQLQEIGEPVFVREPAIILHLQSDEVEAVHQLAVSKGLADADLIREWVREKLRAG